VAAGAAYSWLDDSELVAAPDVPVVDTTGAGDAFLGCFALNLSQGVKIHGVVRRAVIVGAEAVQHRGALLPRGVRIGGQ
jgi:ribokinase